MSFSISVLLGKSRNCETVGILYSRCIIIPSIINYNCLFYIDIILLLTRTHLFLFFTNVRTYKGYAKYILVLYYIVYICILTPTLYDILFIYISYVMFTVCYKTTPGMACRLPVMLIMTRATKILINIHIMAE